MQKNNASAGRAARSYVGLTRCRLTAAYFAAFFAIGVCLASLGPILPALAARSNTSIDGLGVFFVARSSGYMAGSIIGGIVFDRIARTHVPLLFGNLLCALGCAMLPSLRSASALALVIVTQGFCMGILDTGGNVLLIWLHGSGRVEPYMQSMHFFFALGAVISPMAIELTVRASGSEDGFGAAFYGMATLLVLASAPLVGTSGPTPPAKLLKATSASSSSAHFAPTNSSTSSTSSTSASSSASASAATSSSPARLECLGEEGGGNDGANTSSHLAVEREAECGPTTPAPHRRCFGLPPLELQLVACTSLCLCLYVGCEVGFGGFVFTFATDHLRMADTTARALNSCYWGGLALGRLLAIPAAARLRPESVLHVGLIGSAVAAAALLLLAPPSLADSASTVGAGTGGLGAGSGTSSRAEAAAAAAAAASSALVWITTTALGLMHAPIFPTALTHAERHMRMSGRVASVFVVSAALGEALLPACIALAYAVDHASFPRMLVGASVGQLTAWAAARSAARRLHALQR